MRLIVRLHMSRPKSNKLQVINRQKKMDYLHGICPPRQHAQLLQLWPMLDAASAAEAAEASLPLRDSEGE